MHRLVAAVLTILGASLCAQDSNVVLRSSTREVLLEVVVRDAHGRLVNKVDPSQVSVYEDGVRQEIRSFRLVQGRDVRADDEKQAAAAGTGNSAPPPVNPLRTVNVVCLVLNDLTPETRAFAFQSARKFVNREVRPDTFIGVFTLDATGLRPVFPFSNNREHLLKAVELAAVNQLPTVAQNTGAMLNGLSLSLAGVFQNSQGANPSAASLDSRAPGNPADGGTIDPNSADGFADGTSAHNPMGVPGNIGLAVTSGLREIDSLIGLDRQLSGLPFQKTVLLMSTGLTRPPDQLQYWQSLIRSANKGGVTFYGMDVWGLSPYQDVPVTADSGLATTPATGSIALTQRAANLSQGQTTSGLVAPGAGGSSTPSGGPGAGLMEVGRQTDYLRFGVSSANTQEALRELSESTGGFVIANTNDTDKLLARVMEDVDTHYELSYRPSAESRDGHFRKIEVKLARADLRVETRSGYFALPESWDSPPTGAEMAGLRALDAKPMPHAFDFESKAFRFRPEKGSSQYSIAFEVPVANLTATPEPALKKHKYHAALLALVKNAQGEIVEKISKDVPSEVDDALLPVLRPDCMTYERAVNLAPGQYTVETAVVDEETGRASTNVLRLDNREESALAMSDIALLHRIENLQRPPDAADPFEIPGKRATPYVSTALPARADPYVYFVVYLAGNSPGLPALRAKFFKGGRLLATQQSELPLPDESGAVPMAIHAVNAPGDYEVRITVTEGRRSVERSLKYTIAAK